ncbi:MAG: MotA/TolQ/ExbB proton channel family protein [Candidatus Krumholzibacteria bacterium]|jgi:biopolymer transport protein ExbB|nr:MotA/TolQ/ExbB proton channel family protein [Candidatus Krumholzibacteria bacterium]
MKNTILVPITIASLVASWYIWQAAPEYIRQGGPLLVLGLTLLFLALTFAIERFIVLWRAGGRGNVSSFIAAVKGAVHSGDIAAAIASCKQQGGSLANVIGAGLESYRRRRAAPDADNDDALDETRRALQEATALESPNLEQNLTALSTIASIATLIGLLGTTIGMIRSFHAMSRAGAPDATQLALGISEALVNTALGLTTAIIATVLYNHFTTRVDAFNNRVEETGYEVLKLLEYREESGA